MLHLPLDPAFFAADTALFRMPVLPAMAAELTRVDVDDADGLADLLRAVAASPVITEALDVSSSSLSAVLDRVVRGEPVELKQLRRAARSVSRYLVRMATRATPFGLMAGVTFVRFADAGPAKVRLGADHRKAVQPDMAWLAAVARECERSPENLSSARLVANDLCFVRGDRLVLPYVQSAAPGEQEKKELSVRHTAAVQAVMERARRPVVGTDLKRHVLSLFDKATSAQIDGLLTSLVDAGALLSDLRPPLTEPDPLGYVIERVHNTAALQDVRAAVDSYASQPIGSGRPAWRRLLDTANHLHKAETPMQVDLALDADIVLPAAVAEEAVRAASALLRMSPANRAALADYHADFVERYGLGVSVPLAELLDPEAGLGPPAGYRMPAGERQPIRPEPEETERDQALAALVQRALLSGEPEILLDESDVDRLARQSESEPQAIDLYAHLLADSVDALSTGDFRLVLPAGGVAQGGRTFGRFSGVVPGGAEQLSTLARQITESRPGVVNVQLTFPGHRTRSGNVVRVPRLLDQTAAFGVFADHGEEAVLGPDDLAVAADHHRLVLVSARDGREVVGWPFHMLNIEMNAPNSVRLAFELGATSRRLAMPWSWGKLAIVPYLPRVRYGRTVLAPASWLPGPDLREKKLPWSDWRVRLSRWRAEFRVPDHVLASSGDNRVELDLSSVSHQRLLRDELDRRHNVVLQEALTGSGWLDGHRNEIVFTLLPMKTVQAATPSRIVRAEQSHAPGGTWLFAKLYAGTDRHDELIADHLNRFVAGLPTDVTRWFFIRYRDTDPHLRLRFHGDQATLAGDVLPALHDWVADLRRLRLCRRLTIDEYAPEAARYGGPEVLAAAEAAFQADSESAIEQLRLRRAGGVDLDEALFLAANYVDLSRQCDPAGWAERFLRTYEKGAEQADFRRLRTQALTVIDPFGDWQGLQELPGGGAVLASWRRRAAAFSSYGRQLRGCASGSIVDTAIDGMLHMHHNRLRGYDRAAERRSYGIARGAVQALLDRRKFAR